MWVEVIVRHRVVEDDGIFVAHIARVKIATGHRVVEDDDISLAPCAATWNMGYTSPSVWECVKHSHHPVTKAVPPLLRQEGS